MASCIPSLSAFQRSVIRSVRANEARNFTMNSAQSENDSVRNQLRAAFVKFDFANCNRYAVGQLLTSAKASSELIQSSATQLDSRPVKIGTDLSRSGNSR